MSLQDKLQEEFSDYYVQNCTKTCFNISVRLGKTRIGILIMQKLKVEKVLILYPLEDIKKGWEEEFEKMNYKPEIVYSTYLSVNKNLSSYDLIIADEIQKASTRALVNIDALLEINNRFLGLSGTYSLNTKKELKEICNLEISKEYNTEQAIENKIVANYEVIIKQYSLDATKQYLKQLKTKNYYTTETKDLKTYNNRILNSFGESQKFARINRMQWINKCNSLKENTLKLINELKDKRFLLYGADTNFVDSLGIPTFHNKNKLNNNLELFKNETINQLGLVQFASQGVTFKNLDTIIITNINSNSENLFQKLARSLLLDSDNISKIYIITSDEEFQIKWLMSALADVPNNKIKYA